MRHLFAPQICSNEFLTRLHPWFWRVGIIHQAGNQNKTYSNLEHDKHATVLTPGRAGNMTKTTISQDCDTGTWRQLGDQMKDMFARMIVSNPVLHQSEPANSKDQTTDTRIKTKPPHSPATGLTFDIVR